jgi:hypothetical protein
MQKKKIMEPLKVCLQTGICCRDAENSSCSSWWSIVDKFNEKQYSAVRFYRTESGNQNGLSLLF